MTFSDEDETQDEENEVASVARKKLTQKDPSKLLLWSTGKNYLAAGQRLLSENTAPKGEDEHCPLRGAKWTLSP